MLYLLAVLALIAAAALLVRFTKRQSFQPLDSNSFNSLPPENLRPLFEPTEDELLEYRREQLEVQAAKEKELVEDQRADREERLRKLLGVWRTEPSRVNTSHLLAEAAGIGEAEAFSEIAEEILKVFKHQGIGGLSPKELAALIDSHSRLLPQAERSSGALFWLKEETARMCS